MAAKMIKYGNKDQVWRQKMRSMAAQMINYSGGGKNEKYAYEIEKYSGKLLYINWRQKFHESGK